MRDAGPGPRDPSFVLRIRRRVCGLLLNPTCPDSSGIYALGRRRRPSGRLERGAPLRRRRRVAKRRHALTPSTGCPSSQSQGVCGDRLAPGLRCRRRWSRRAHGQTVAVWGYCPYGDPRRAGSSQAWAAVHGLRGVGLRTLRFFVNCRRAADAYGDPPVQAYRSPGAGLGWRGAGHDGV